MEDLTFVSTIFYSWIIASLSIVSIFLEMENQTIISTIFCSWIIANLSIVVIFSSNGKSDRWLTDFILFYYSQSIHSFNLFLKWKMLPWIQRFVALGLKPIYP